MSFLKHLKESILCVLGGSVFWFILIKLNALRFMASNDFLISLASIVTLASAVGFFFMDRIENAKLRRTLKFFFGPAALIVVLVFGLLLAAGGYQGSAEHRGTQMAVQKRDSQSNAQRALNEKRQKAYSNAAEARRAALQRGDKLGAAIQAGIMTQNQGQVLVPSNDSVEAREKAINAERSDTLARAMEARDAALRRGDKLEAAVQEGIISENRGRIHLPRE